MGTKMLIGVIDGGDWRVAQYCNSLEDEPEYQGKLLLDCLNANLTEIYENLSHCRFIAKYGDNIETTKEHPNFDSLLGVDIFNEIIACDKYDTVWLCDSRSFLDDELYCEFAFVINYDIEKLSCYHHGRRFLFGEYNLEQLPTIEVLLADYEASIVQHQKEVKKIVYAPMAEMIRKRAVESGLNPDEEEQEFWFKMES